MSDELIADQESFAKRVGDKVKRIDFNHLSNLEEMIRSSSPYLPTLDVNRPQSISTDEVSYTDVFKNALYVTPQNDELSFKLAHIAHSTYTGDIKESREKLLELMSMEDKYHLKKNNKSSSSVMILPGSNLIRKIVDLGQLAKWAYLDQKLVFKLHPLTSEEDFDVIKNIVGLSRVVPKDESGFNLMCQAKRIYCASNSELGLYAAVLGKEVIDITRFTESSSTTYAALYRFLNYPYTNEDLIKVLSNSTSGLFFYQNTKKQDVNSYFNLLVELQSINKSYSNVEYVNKLKKRGKR